jgi:hypothetical protein
MVPRSTEPAALQISSKEISRDDAIKRLLLDNELSDMTLQGTDGVTVNANRCILAARSHVFRVMLFGNFCEANNTIVQVGYTGKIIKALVEYIYTDESSLLEKARVDEHSRDGKDTARTIITLAMAALYFDLPELCRKTREFTIDLLQKQKKLACTFWKECRAIGPAAADTGIDEVALEVIRLNLSIVLQGFDLASLSPLLLEEIVRDEEVDADELTLFKLVKSWVESRPQEDRQTAAKHIIKYIRLEKIDPKKLANLVSSNGLVTDAQLSEAFKAQALSLAERHGALYPKRRRLSLIWSDSQSDVFSACGFGEGIKATALEVPAMTSGLFRWTVKVEDFRWTVRLGVSPAANLTLQKRWVCCNDGSIYNSRCLISRGNPEYGEGDIVTFDLDINATASLRYSVNSGPYTPIFTHMLLEPGGFSPVVALSTGSVRILRFEQLAFSPGT